MNWIWMGLIVVALWAAAFFVFRLLTFSNVYCRNLLKQFPKTARPVYFRMGENFEALQDIPAARKCFREYLDREPGGVNAAEAWRKLGWLM